ncbi:MAG TPA: penicillin-binding transpeptidase domain-containing protein, partial [Candidatus Saccharibacteria bacterium]|nr:penicillin-binding transpeptidase domain-containing protein [Candidatus Saccharibacteria bacterium]
RPAVNGDDIVLTIDRNVQEYAEQVLKDNAERLKTKNASIVIMNPNNGQVMAMANYPTYEPANYSKTTDYSLFQNTVVNGPYEAGSVIKALTVAAGLDTGAITPTSTSPNPNGCTTVADRTICNVVRTVGTQPTTQDLLTFSLNTGAVNVLRSMGGGDINYSGRQKFYTYLNERYRFTKQTGIEQSNEAKGLVYSPDNEQGNNVRYANMTFGQGMTTTMIQVASAFSATINGGTYYRPTLVYGTRSSDGSVKTVNPTVVQQNVIAKQHSDEMRDLLWHARYDRTGKLTDRGGYRIGGKTGTSEVIDPQTGKYTSDHTIGSYLGFGGGSTPEYVIMIRMDDAQGGVFAGSTTASQMFGTISNWLITYKNIPPVS